MYFKLTIGNLIKTVFASFSTYVVLKYFVVRSCFTITRIHEPFTTPLFYPGKLSEPTTNIVPYSQENHGNDLKLLR